MSKIGIFGGGYVGLVTGTGFAALGHDVTVREIRAERVEDLNAGRLPIYEPGLEEVFEENRERLRFTTRRPRAPTRSSSASGHRRPTRATQTSPPCGRFSTTSRVSCPTASS